MIRTPIKAIRAKCLDCSCGQIAEVRLCPSVNCPLYPYRMGHRPKVDKDTTEVSEHEKTSDSPQIILNESVQEAHP